MKRDLATKEDKPLTTRGAADVAHGGIGKEDLILPRVMLLQQMTPDVASYYPAIPGNYVDSITKEIVEGTFIPLFAFKFYAKFAADRKMEWGTVDGTDPRVVEGLRWYVDALGNKKTEATEMLNFLILLDSDPTTPRVLTFKRSSIKAGRQFLTRLSLIGAKEKGMYYDHRYALSSREANGVKGTYFVPTIDSPKTKEESNVDVELRNYAALLVDKYFPLMHQVAEAAASESDNEVEETPF